MNDLGAMTGSIQTVVRRRGHAAYFTHVAIFNTDGAITDLQTTAIVPAGVTLTDAKINNNSEIVADGTDAAGLAHAYLLQALFISDATY